MANSSEVNLSDILSVSGVGALQRSVISLRKDLSDSKSLTLCAPFFTNCDAVEFVEVGHWWREPRDLPVKLLSMIHVVRLECVKSIEFMASVQRSFLSWSSLDSRAVTDLLESVS